MGEISVSAPCALLLEKIENGWKLSVTDAEMNKDLKSIKVKTTLPVSGNLVTKEGKWNVIDVTMHQGAMCGKPASAALLMK